MKQAELYLHIPFCVRKCEYCDFLSAAPKDFAETEAYLSALLHEAEEKAEDLADYEIISIFIGGGTPSILRPRQIQRLMEGLYRWYRIREDAEITMECNPGTVDREKLKIMKASGINRISFGLQSCSREELQLLGRIHTFEEFLDGYQTARQTGFTNINVDLMFGLPNQSLKTYKDTLQKVIALEPEHISAYGLIIEEGTPFYQRYEEDERARQRGEEPRELPSEETERLMYLRTAEILRHAGYQRYEISNYAKKGMECRHNMGYWTGVEYLGLGLGASSMMKVHLRHRSGELTRPDPVWRFRTNSDLSSYIKGDFHAESETALSLKEQMEEYAFLGLRLTKGISKAEFGKRFHRPFDSVYRDTVRKAQKEGLLAEEGDRVRLTPAGIDISNYVLSQFLLDS